MEDIIARAKEREIDLEMEKKRKKNFVLRVEGSGKRPKVVDSRWKGQQVQGHCRKCGWSHKGTCRVGGYGCFKCVQTGHINKDCTATTTITPGI